MTIQTFNGTIDGIDFSVMMLNGTVPYLGMEVLNEEQREDALAVILEAIAEHRAARQQTREMEIKFTDPSVCAYCGTPPAPANYIMCDDCHHMIDPADEMHMCVERRYRLDTAPRIMSHGN